MKTLTYKCVLLSDVILHSRSASEGTNDTLDFIPGSCFLGIAASSLYCKIPERAMDLFHNASVRFSDAHLERNNMRSYKIPASICRPKLDNSKYYIHHCVNHDSEDIIPLQLKQCRSGFYIFDSVTHTAEKLDSPTFYAVKSAFDKNKRRSMDEQMYCYESLAKGLSFIFDVEVEDESLVDEIDSSLVGKRHLGRSRTAQYGLVEITRIEEPCRTVKSVKGKFATVYADGRLIFLDRFAQPTFVPTAEQLGLPEGSEILWDFSQVRTFQYAPYNGKRHAFDTDRCGIEKGSVFVVKTEAELSGRRYVGVYNNEGFGRVIYNPEFLAAKSDGRAEFGIVDNGEGTTAPISVNAREAAENTLYKYLESLQTKEDSTITVYGKVNAFRQANAILFGNGSFASQWGAIRNIAVVSSDEDVSGNIKKFIEHGVASEVWKKKGRKNALFDFMDKCECKMLRKTMINLCAEMAKIKYE